MTCATDAPGFPGRNKRESDVCISLSVGDWTVLNPAVPNGELRAQWHTGLAVSVRCK